MTGINRYVEAIDLEKEAQVSARLKLKEKLALIKLAKNKGAEGLTGLFKMLAVAKEVNIKL